MDARKPDLQKVGLLAFLLRTFIWNVPQRGRKCFTAFIKGKSLEGMFDVCYKLAVGIS
jgi:hypothetical protein